MHRQKTRKNATKGYASLFARYHVKQLNKASKIMFFFIKYLYLCKGLEQLIEKLYRLLFITDFELAMS